MSPTSSRFHEQARDRHIHVSQKERVTVDSAGGISERHSVVPRSFKDINTDASKLGKAVIDHFFALPSDTARADNVTRIREAATLAENVSFKGNASQIKRHQEKVGAWLAKGTNGAGFRDIVPKMDELTQSSRTAAQLSSMQTSAGARGRKKEDSEDLIYETARLFSALREPTGAVRMLLKRKGTVMGPVHPSGAPPSEKIPGAGSASTGTHQARSDWVNSVGAEGLKTDPARAIIAMGAMASQFTYNAFSGPPDASNSETKHYVHTGSRREAGKQLAIDLAKLAYVKGIKEGIQPKAAPLARLLEGHLVSPMRITSATTTTTTAAPSSAIAPVIPVSGGAGTGTGRRVLPRQAKSKNPGGT